MRIYLLSMFIVLLTITSIAIVVYSDSGYFVVYSEKIVFDRLPRQTALIIYRGGYEYLFVITNFLIRGSSTKYNIIYYFPLPEKPVSFNIAFINGSAEFSAEIEYRRSVLINYLNQRIMFRSVFFATAGGTGISSKNYVELAIVSNPFLNVSLVKAIEPDVSVFEQILRDKGYSGEIPSGLKDIIQYYKDKGWKYFVVGLVTVPSTFNLIQQYVFKTDKIVYPLYVDKLNNELSARIATYIVTDRVIDKIIDPTNGEELNAGRLFKGLNYELIVESDDKETLVNLYESLKEVINDPGFPKELRDIISIKLRDRLTVSFKGLVYAYDESDIALPSIESDLIAIPSPINDITMQLIDDPAALLPSVTPSPISIIAVMLAIIPVAVFLGMSPEEENRSGEDIVSSYIVSYAFLIFILVLLGNYITIEIVGYTGLLLITRLLGIVIWFSPIVAIAILTDERVGIFLDTIRNYMMLSTAILIITCWYSLNILSPFLLVITTLLFYNNIRPDIKKETVKKNYAILITAITIILAILYGFILYAGLKPS